MIRQSLLVILACLASCSCFAQLFPVTVSGHAETFPDDGSIKDVEIIISKGADTIARVKTDVDGNFSLNLELEFEDELKLTTRHRRYAESVQLFKLQSKVRTSFSFELTLNKIIHHGEPPAPFMN